MAPGGPSSRETLTHLRRPFTLHEHCGGLTDRLRSCLRAHGVPHSDPMSLSPAEWERASDCRDHWEAFRRCGRDLIDTLDEVAERRCKDEVAAAQECRDKMGVRRAGAACESYEFAALRCLGKKIVLRMSEKAVLEAASPPDGAG